MMDLPKIIPIFPLARALLLPRGALPLVIFEPRYLAMIHEALASHQIIGMIQPKQEGDVPPLYEIGCLGRITTFNEIEGGRVLIALSGLNRFELVRELETDQPFRQIEASYEKFQRDMDPEPNEEEIDLAGLLSVLRRYLKKNNLQADLKAIDQASSASLVTAISILSSYGVVEKQALLEARDSAKRCSLLIALTELALALDTQEPHDAGNPTLQ